MTLHPNEEFLCVRCDKQLGWLVDADGPGSFSLMCEECARVEHTVPSAEEREAWAKQWGRPALAKTEPLVLAKYEMSTEGLSEAEICALVAEAERELNAKFIAFLAAS